MAGGIRSLIAQFQGKRNIFKYTTTAINQTRLMYWLVGEFYYSDMFDQTIRLCWGSLLIISSLTMMGHCLAYIVFTSSLQFPSILSAIQAILCDFYLLALFPLMSHVYRNDIAESLKILDRLNCVKFEKIPFSSVNFRVMRRKKYGKNVLLKIFATHVGMSTCFFVCSNLYLMIGFTIDKLKDPDYYLYPTYCERVENGMTFVVLLISQFVPTIPMILMALFVPGFSLATAREFYHRFQSICDVMDHQSKLLTAYYEQQMINKGQTVEQLSKYETLFVRNIRLYGQYHRDLFRAISYFKKYLQFSMTACVLMFLYNEIILVYILFVSTSIVTQIKTLSMATGVGSFLYVICLIGRLFFEMAEMFNESVYNMPWYYLSPSNRKSTYFLFLYQAQVAIQFKAIKVYPIDMTFFLRMCSHVYSSVNVLRRYYKRNYEA